MRQTLEFLAACWPEGALAWLQEYRLALEAAADCPSTMTGVAAAMLDLGFIAPQGEMLYWLLRLPGAAVHGLERQPYGWRHYSFLPAA